MSIPGMTTHGKFGPLLSMNEAGDRLHVNPRTIRRYISIGLLPGYKIGNQSVRVLEADVDALIEKSRIPHARIGKK